MASVAITAGSGTPIRTVTNAAVDGGAHQQVFTIADANGTLLGTAAAAVPVTQAAVIGTGSIAAVNAFVQVAPQSNATLVVQVTGTFVATLQLQGSQDGATFVTMAGAAQWLNLATGAYQTSITAPGLYQTTVSALQYVRVTATAYTSGTATLGYEAEATNALVGLDAPLPTGSATIGAVNLNPGSNLLGSVGIGATTSSIGAYILTSTASTNAAAIKAAAGFLQEITVSNPTATAAFVKLYNKASAPTVGTDIPVLTVRVAATGAAGDVVALPLGANGKRFGTGIAIAVTAAAAATDTTAAVAGVQVHATYV